MRYHAVFCHKRETSSLNPETVCPKSNGHMLRGPCCTIGHALTTAFEEKEGSNKTGKYIMVDEEQPGLSLHMKGDLKLFS